MDNVGDAAKAVKGVCFVAGTLVKTENGSVPIEGITEGMLVYAHNPDSGETELKEVVQTFVRETSELVHIKVNGEEIITTPTHPFWVPEKGWTDAIQLRAGDRLQLLNGEYVIIEQVQHELLESPVTVYNFEVEDFHTYYITETQILVHNANCGFDSDQQIIVQWAKEYKRTGISMDDAEALVDLAKQYNVPGRIDFYHKRGIWKDTPHIHIGPIDHIKIK